MEPFIWTGLLSAVLFSGCAPKTGTTGGTETASGTTAASGEEIPIGEYEGMTGATASFGDNTHNGITLAVEEINAAGGVNGKKLKVYLEDDESQKEKVRPVITKLITQNKAVAILGEVASSRSIAAAPVCEQYSIPMISPSSTNTAVTVKENGDVRGYVFRICFIDPFQGEAMAKFLHDTLKFNKVAVFRNVKEDYSKGLADAFIKTFTSEGGTITKDISYSTGDKDFRAQLTTIKADNPQAVYVPGYYTEIGLIAQQAKDAGLTVPLAGGDGWDEQETTKNPAMEGHYFTNHCSITSQAPKIKTFVDIYVKRFNKQPNALAALGYDAANVLADAIKRSKSLGGSDLKDAIASTKDFPGVTGAITINEKHNTNKAIVVLQYKGGKQVQVTSISPD
jgi:branched-chain amino acid transport system substrate-binding protein